MKDENTIIGFGTGGKCYLKKRIPIEAKQILHPFFVKTLEGTMEAKKMDYLIKGVKGELYPCDREIFETTYEDASKVVPVISIEWLKRWCKQNTVLIDVKGRRAYIPRSKLYDVITTQVKKKEAKKKDEK